MPTTSSTNSAALVLPDPADATNAAATQEIPDIRGLKDVIDIPTGNEWVLWLFVAAAALVVAGVAAWFVRRRLARRSEELAPLPPPPPHVVAWERLQRALGLIHEAEQFCTEVSQIIRVYLEERFNFTRRTGRPRSFCLNCSRASAWPANTSNCSPISSASATW